MSILATIVDWAALGETALAALLAGVGVALSLSLAILGAARLSDPSSDAGLLGSLALGLLTFVGLAATLAAVVFGIIVMTSS